MLARTFIGELIAAAQHLGMVRLKNGWVAPGDRVRLMTKVPSMGFAGTAASQTVLCPTRQRMNVLWAMGRDQRPYPPVPVVDSAS
ncbi:hypothetical protein HDA32_002677 [Spinactinospora alkalitolerans]|uniref:Uncharacterized protein n=1 Tax=Spinactinospora alkalitolerans TaxID=687207 RepID=A0A852TW74_9ACTN|nr:hypothetical protein [Spinactinospora alkalitolerans]NYE47557.1 hypothetical protein [Spinactinospora alkalitolerans]